jgi:hypothetical protein
MGLQCLNERDQLENMGIDGRTILNVSWQNMWKCVIDLSGSRYALVVRSCEHSNKYFCSKKKAINFLTTWVTVSFSRRALLQVVNYDAVRRRDTALRLRVNFVHFLQRAHNNLTLAIKPHTSKSVAHGSTFLNDSVTRDSCAWHLIV